MTSLLIAEHDNNALADVTLKTASACTALGGETHILIAGADCDAVAQEASKITGISKVIKVDNALYDKMLAEPMAELVVSLAEPYEHILAPASTNGKNLMPRIAALLDASQISDITKIIDANTFERPIYAGNAIQTVKSTEAKKLLTVRGTAFAASDMGSTAEIETIDALADKGLSSFMGEELTASDRPELTSARIIISGGRGMGSGENFAILEKLADRLGAGLGASRAAVDAGYVPNDYQVGQTGKVVAPELYIAVGISGAIQHLAGMKDSKIIVAINKDEDAPIFQIADYGWVADLFTAIPELESALDSAGS